MLLDPAETRLELADDNPVAHDRSVVVDRGAPEPHDLFAELLARG